jgi:lipoprotein-anchoring transpeptidase ErfK/SrfK
VNTLKSAALVVVLTGVLVAVYVTVYQPPAAPPPGMTQQEVDELAPPEVEEWDDRRAQSDDFSQPDRSDPPTSPLAGHDHSLYGPSVVPPTSEDLSNLNPADAAAPEGRSLGHSEPLAADRSAAPSVYSLPAPAAPESSAGGSSPAAEYDVEAVARRLTLHSFKREWEQAQRQVDEGQFRAALATLTPYYGKTDLPAEHQAHLAAWLDALAAKVVYSRQHLLANPYRVRGSQERMIDVAKKFNVTAQLLQNVNASAVNNPDVMLPGTELKVIPGPFRAEVSLARNEITVYLQDLYAGRFPFALGDEPVSPGQYQVHQKQVYPTYVGNDGRTIAGNDPANPYGGFCLNLGSQVRIHGSSLIAPQGSMRGCISLSPKDAEDLYGILDVGGIVVIK